VKPGDDIGRLLEVTKQRAEWLEATDRARREAFEAGRRTLEDLRRHRHKGASPMIEAASRAALRTVVLAAGCVMLITGATTLDPAAGGAAIIASFGVLLMEGIR